MGTARLATYSRYDPYLETYVQVTLAGESVRSVSFPDEPDPDASEDHELLDRIEAYLSGTVKDDFADVPIAFSGSGTEQAVLEAVRRVPYGQNALVEEIAREAEPLDANRSEDHDRVREILDANRVPIIVPDHRVRDGPSGAPPGVEQRLRSLEQIAK